MLLIIIIFIDDDLIYTCNSRCVTWCIMMVAKHFYSKLSAFCLLNSIKGVAREVVAIQPKLESSLVLVGEPSAKMLIHWIVFKPILSCLIYPQKSLKWVLRSQGVCTFAAPQCRQKIE